jgi:prepilin-type N-terminal cleavage/methylation domain-containing protein
MRRTGFTLIELLLVIAIIAVLAALLIPMIGYARRAAKEAKCQTQLAAISAAIARYKDVNGTIPEKYPATGTDVYAATFKSGNAYKTVDQLTSTDWTTIAQALLEQLQTVDRDNFRDLSSLRDPFTGGAVATNVFRYRPSKFYPAVDVANGQASGKLIDGYGRLADGTELPPNPDSYQLWSTGFDGKDQFGERVNGRKSDDITNWKTN